MKSSLPSDILLIVKYIVFVIIILFTVCKKTEHIKKQIFHAFLFNIRNYSPEVINIILPRVNNFDITQKRHEIFVFYMLPTSNKIREDKG